ncbi:MAG TPA: thermonuclease family protein [Anaerolineales bacterium]|nr:thermonuclease family protein [Anaerolineales bacterium]
MGTKKKTAKLPIGCLFASGIIAFLWVGGLGLSALGAVLTETQSPTFDVSPIVTDAVETETPENLDTVVGSGFVTHPPASTVTSDPVIIPVTGGSCIPNNPPQTGRVVDVVDGDTIKVLLDSDGLTYSVRYIGMDTPEDTSQVEYFGPEATARNTELVAGKAVTLIKDVSETDQYGRLLRYVIVDGLFVNYELVSQGYANTASYPPDTACIPTFQTAEQEASASRLGLWLAPPTLVPTLAVIVPTEAPAGGGDSVCDCSGPDLDCGDFSTHAAAQACYDYCVSQGYGDIFRLDGNDNDGLACESLP